MGNGKIEFRTYIKFVSKFIREYRKRIIICISISVFSMIFAMLNPMISQYIIDNVLMLKRINFLLEIILVLVVISIANSLFHFLFSYVLNNIFLDIGNSLKNYIFNHIVGLDIAVSNKLSLGQMIYSLFTDTEILKSSFGQIIFGGVYNIILLIFFTIYMLATNSELAIFVIVTQSIQLFFLLYFPKRIKKKNYEKKKIYEVIMNRTIEILDSLYLLKSCNGEKRELEKFNNTMESYKLKSRNETFLSLLFSEISGLLTTIVQFGVIGYGGYLVANNNLTLGELTAFIVVANMLNTPLSSIVTVISNIQDSMSSLSRILEITSLSNVKYKQGMILNSRLEGNISLRNVNFAYQGKKQVLRNINLELQSRNIYSIIGKSGAGKTTLCMILSKFYYNTSGSILIDGIDIDDISTESFRSNVGILLQNNFLFSGTIKENILLGKLDASDKEVEKAARLANAHEFICNMPDGYSTQVGSNGKALSGGQIQRIALARLFLQRPSVIILDEPTSFLDGESEEVIKKSLQLLSKESTILLVTHKLDTAKIATKIILIEDGGVKEVNSDNKFIKGNSVYKDLYI